MRWTPTVVDVAVAVALWTAVLTIERRWRAEANSGASAADAHSYNLQRYSAISATTGATCFIAWLITDSVGPRWLHSLLEVAALILIGVAAVLSGYAAWVKARQVTLNELAKAARRDRMGLAIAGGVFVLLRLSSFYIPNPTRFQERTFVVALALAAGMAGGFVPGAIAVEGKRPSVAVRATAAMALAVFIIILFYRSLI